MSYVDEVIDLVVKKNPAEPEFHQAVKEAVSYTHLDPAMRRSGGYEIMMRGLQTTVRAIRRRVFTEVAKLGFKADAKTLLDDMESIPYDLSLIHI